MIKTCKHKVSGKDIYQHRGKHYTLENGNFMLMPELSKTQKRMISILHSGKASNINF